MPDVTRVIDETESRFSGLTVQDYLERDSRPVPDFMRESHPRDFGTAPISTHRYTSTEWYQRELSNLWTKTWQMACHEQEIPEIGDRTLYEVGSHSFIIVRSGAEEISAYYNSCLHRGNKLCVEAEGSRHIRCPFHGWTWDLDGKCTTLTGEWDFPQLDQADLALPQVKIARWLGWIFINMDENATSFEEYLTDEVTGHFRRWGYQDRQVIARVSKVFPVNWKALMDAFIESYHVAAVHPQIATTTGDFTTQYDVLSEHVGRMITLTAVPGSVVGFDMSEQELADDMAGFGFVDADGEPLQVPDGQRARAVIAEAVRGMIREQSHVDLDHWSDSELIDGIEYFVFPNFTPWGCLTIPAAYRFLPHEDPDHGLMEVYILAPTPPGTPKAKPVHRVLRDDQTWSDAPEMGPLGTILDQDTVNLLRLQQGMKASRDGGLRFSAYQESRIRHYHHVLDQYLGV